MTTETARPRFKRKQYIVAKRFQLQYVGLILLLMFLTAILCSYVVYYTSMLLLGEKLANVYPQGRLVAIIKMVNFRMFMSVLLISPFVAMIGIYLSHKIAGPIYRMEKFLAGMISGDLVSRLVLRKGDELTVLAEGINSLGDDLRVTIKEERARLANASNQLQILKKTVASKSHDLPGVSESITKLEAEVSAISKVVEKYKL